jgi:hypothetical protein
MATTTVAFGIALIGLGIGGYFGTGSAHPTALIPAAFGLVLVILGSLARDPAKRKMSMHIAVVVGLLGLLGSIRGLISLPALLSGADVPLPAAVISKSLMAIVCAVFVGLCVRSFIEARRSRTGQSPA